MAKENSKNPKTSKKDKETKDTGAKSTKKGLKKEFKFTTIVKTNNSEKTLCETLEAIKDFCEIVVVDSHSTDDTVEIAREYKTKIVFADKLEPFIGLNSAIEEASYDWVLFLEGDEITPYKLLEELEKYVLNPKKSKEALSVSKKTFYFNKELKAARIKEELRFFKKGAAIFEDNYSPKIKLLKGKFHKLNKNFKQKNVCVLKYLKSDLLEDFQDILQKNKQILKKEKITGVSIFIKPLFCFLKNWILKGAYLEGRLGYIFAQKEAIKKFILEVMKLEKQRSKKENDF